ncbi:hypothetical protein BKA70DRAFT_1504814 [Coprinopsis sp. MPI-PUGE-AT-0042]|nr:hypothetical protein BKA70DRAFT_1504814 [Coprinopsis sp. MPI-PUGE-AT-0042]
MATRPSFPTIWITKPAKCTGMHRCLQTSDTLLSIFELFLEIPDDWEGVPPGFESLSSLAQTCKAFQDPAIRTLWRDIPGLYVIACLFPEKSLKLDRAKRYIPASEPLDFEAFIARLSVYRHYVKSIGYSSPNIESEYTPESLHSGLLFLLLECTRIPTPLFPNAHHVTIPCLKDLPMVSWFYPPLVLGPSIRSISLHTDDVMVERKSPAAGWHPKGDARQWDVIESALLRTAPKLHSFSIDVPELEAGSELLERPQIDRIVQHLSIPVTKIVLPNVLISHASLVVLGSLPMLSFLDIVLGEKSQKVAESQNGSTLHFSSLDTLRVTVLNKVNKADFLAQLCGPVLRKCTISISRLLDEDEEIPLDDILDPFFQQDRQPLTHLTLSNDTANTVDWCLVPFRITARTLRLLSRCSSLTNLYVGHAALRDKITDEDLARAFSCWGRLESFSLMVEDRCDPDNHLLTAKGVYEAVKACSSLHRLVLPCDFRAVPSNLQGDGEPHRSLKRWNVCGSPIGTANDVGLWLKARFPGLQTLEFDNYPRSLISPVTAPSYDIWPRHQEGLITLTQWILVRRVLHGETRANTELDR